MIFSRYLHAFYSQKCVPFGHFSFDADAILHWLLPLTHTLLCVIHCGIGWYSGTYSIWTYTQSACRRREWERGLRVLDGWHTYIVRPKRIFFLQPSFNDDDFKINYFSLTLYEWMLKIASPRTTLRLHTNTAHTIWNPKDPNSNSKTNFICEISNAQSIRAPESLCLDNLCLISVYRVYNTFGRSRLANGGIRSNRTQQIRHRTTERVTKQLNI